MGGLTVTFVKSISWNFATTWEFSLSSNERRTGTTTIKPCVLNLPGCSKKRVNTIFSHHNSNPSLSPAGTPRDAGASEDRGVRMERRRSKQSEGRQRALRMS